MRQYRIEFEEIQIPLRQPDSLERKLAYSPAGKVPVLLDGDMRIWDSLAIVEHLAEKFPDKQLWPADDEERALARRVSAEMHSGFANLRFQTYGVELERVEAAYARTILATPTVRGWIEDAHKEPWSIVKFDQT